MWDLSWLRHRIWVAVALPLAVGCDRSKPGSWQVTSEGEGCGWYERWCGPPELADRWASGDERQGRCPTAITIPPKGTEGRPELGRANGEVALSGVEEALCCYTRSESDCKGRPLIDGDRAIVAPAAPAPGAEAARWLAAALDEHASIASFARATLELLAVGAPPDLIAGCQEAALDEVRHARACFALAARHGATGEPGPLPALPPRGGGLARVARDTFVEGCVGETIGAAIAAAQAAVEADPEVRALMARIADDEARHAELAWRTVRWAIGVDPAAAAAVRAAAPAVRVNSAADPVAAAVWRDVIDPTLAALAG